MSITEGKDPTNILTGKDKDVCLEFIRFLYKGYIDDSLRLTNKETLARIDYYMEHVDPLFLAKTVVYIRTAYNVRAISNFVAAGIFGKISGKRWAKNFYDKIIVKPVDMLEIAEVFIRNGTKLPSSVKKGFLHAFDRFDSVQLVKSQEHVNGFSMKDLINLVHPKANNNNKSALESVMKNEPDKNNITMDEKELFKKINNIGLD